MYIDLIWCCWFLKFTRHSVVVVVGSPDIEEVPYAVATVVVRMDSRSTEDMEEITPDSLG